MRQLKEYDLGRQKDSDTNRIWWRDGGVHQNITHAVNPDPISGHTVGCKKLQFLSQKNDEYYGDFVDIFCFKK